MAASHAATAIEVDDTLKVIDLVERAVSTSQPLILVRNGKEIATILPRDTAKSRARRRNSRAIGFEAAFGAWSELVDGDALLEEIYADRERGNDPFREW